MLISPPELHSKGGFKLMSVCACSATSYSLKSPGSMEFSRQEYQSGLLFPPPGYLPNPGIEPMSPVSPALAGRFFITELPGDSRVYQSPLQKSLPNL